MIKFLCEGVTNILFINVYKDGDFEKILKNNIQIEYLNQFGYLKQFH